MPLGAAMSTCFARSVFLLLPQCFNFSGNLVVPFLERPMLFPSGFVWIRFVLFVQFLQQREFLQQSHHLFGSFATHSTTPT